MDRGAKGMGRPVLQEGSGWELKKRPAPSRHAASPAAPPTRNGNHVGNPPRHRIWLCCSNLGHRLKLEAGRLGRLDITSFWASCGGWIVGVGTVGGRQDATNRPWQFGGMKTERPLPCMEPYPAIAGGVKAEAAEDKGVRRSKHEKIRS